MTKQSFDVVELTSFDQSSTSSLVGKPKTSHAWRKILIAVVVLALVVGCIVGLVLGISLDQSGRKSKVMPPQPQKQTWMSKSCLSKQNQAQCPWKDGRHPLLVLYLDGFKADYLHRNVTPVIQRLIGCGVHTSELRPVYPSVTFPNGQSIVTGLYPESHGVVDNHMYDVNIDEEFKIPTRSRAKRELWSGEPVWATAKKQGKRSATFMWPMTPAINISGIVPDIQQLFDPDLTPDKGVARALEWLDLSEEERPDFITVFSSEPASTGHSKGPGSVEVTETLRQLDNTVLTMMEGLYERGLDQCVNIILVAGNGMTSTSCERNVDLDCYTDVDDLLIFDGTVGRISTEYRREMGSNKIVKNTNGPQADRVTSDLECRSDHYKVFQRDTLPVRFHYSNNARIGDVIIDTEDGWLVYQKQSAYCPKGSDGYDNLDKAMQALFVGYGPSFKEGLTAASFENIEIYNLMCDLLEITPASNNGTYGSLHQLLKNPPVITLPTTATSLKTCPRVIGDWTQLRQCTCTNAEQQSFISKTSTLPASMPPGLESPTLYTGDRMCSLQQHNNNIGFSHTLHMPRWVATTMTSEHEVPSVSASRCIIPDNRVNSSERTLVMNVQPFDNNLAVGNLLPDNYFGESCGDIVLSSTLVPMYSTFRTGIWQYLWEVAHDYAGSGGDVSITTGPIFDHNHDGHVDRNEEFTRYVDVGKTVALPTHFYMILVKCEVDTEILPCNGKISTLSFVLPHTQKVPNCLDYRSYLEDNVVRIRDIELLTGLHFLDQFPYLSNMAARLHIGQELWQSNVPTRRDENRTQNAPKKWIDWACPSEGGSCQSDYKPVLLISMDGFRADYINRNVTPIIHKLIQHGVHTPYLRPVYPTYTFPNHYSIVTGLYPESHGIIDNKMYDMTMNKSFSIGSPTTYDTRWWGGEPMWLTSKRQGKKSATFFWVGSDMEIQGDRPNYYKNYSNSEPYVNRVNTVLEWLAMTPEKRPEFITLYFNQPDSAGHQYGPDDTEHMNPVLKNVDDMMGLLMDGLYKLKLHNCVNIILLADHGMTPRSCDRAVSLNDVFYDDEMEKMGFYTGMFGRISNKYSRKGKTYTHYDPPVVPESTILDRLRCLSPHMRTYRKEELPKRHHYMYNQRIDNIVMDVDNEWIISRTRNPTSGCSGGSHGEDNIYASEGALFVAHGPAFKQGIEVEPFENIEVYNLIADVLGITPAPNNGTKGTLYHFLRKAPKEEGETIAEYRDCQRPVADIQQAAAQSCSCSGLSAGAAPYTDLPALPVTSSPPCQVAYGQHTSVFSSKSGLPKWSAVYLNISQKSVSPENPGCVIPDPSLSTEERNLYKKYNNPDLGITAGNLVAALSTTSCGSVSLSSSLVPMYKGFKDGIWKYAWTLIDSYLSEYGELQVTAGPIWDYNLDGLYEGVLTTTRFVDSEKRVILPTHYFLVVSKCHSPRDRFPCEGKTDLLPLILPHTPHLSTCESSAHFLFENVARLRDIELLTGIKFFSNMSLALSAPLRTFLPTALWDSPVLKPAINESGLWMNHSCASKLQEQCTSGYKPLLLISLDGFKADYLDKYNITPVIQRLADCGVHAKFMRAVYPTKTFPNHYTIVTGLYPESHGIIDNNMYDPHLHQKFSLSSDNKLDPRWWQGEPIWQTVQKVGKKAASFFWPGSDVKDISPNYFKIYLKGNVKYLDRVDTILYWMTRPSDRRPDFLTLYVDEPDHQAHQDGPDARSVQKKLEEVDDMIGYLMDGLYHRGLHNCVNIVLLADHGMSKKSCTRMVSLQSHLSRSELGKVYVYDGPFGRISNKYTYGRNNNNPLSTPLVTKDTLLNRLQCKSSHLRVYEKSQLPVRHHYVNNIRIDDIILDVDDRWLVSRTGSVSSYCKGGDHGYDNLYQSMGALFVAHGPAFKEGLMVDTFDNIELYNLMTTVLDVPPAPNNGTPGALNHMLKNPPVLEDTRQQPDYQNCSVTEDSGTFTSLMESVCNCTITEATPDMVPVQLPGFTESSSTCLIHRDHTVSVYSQDINMPLWVAVTVSQDKANMTVYPEEAVCVIPDPILDPAERTVYSKYSNLPHGITIGSLVPGFNDSCSTAQPSSLVVPMYDGFRTGIWRNLWQLISEYADKYGTLVVTAGPVFDHNIDGRYEGVVKNLTRYVDSNETVPLPTHFFVVVHLCQNQSSFPCGDKLQLLSFILPHQEDSPNCLNVYKQLHENIARVRDIELITGLQFFTDIPVAEAAQLLTFLPTTLWDAPGISEEENSKEWKDLPCPGTENNTCTSDYKPLLLVALDGFRSDYLSRGLTPVLQRLIDCGSHSPYMRPSYPSKTFPNMYTLVTGLYPESHGLVDNTMYDFSMGKKFRMGGQHSSDTRWWGGEPIWLTAKRQGKRTATYFWVGSDIEINGSRPDIYRRYDGSVPFTQRVETVVDWMSKPAGERPDFVSLYFNQPDLVGHTDGPTSDEVDESLAMLDELMGLLMTMLYQKNIHNCVNIVITADHGMAPIECDRLFLFSNFYTSTELRTFYVYEGAFAHISNKYKYKSSDVVTEVSSPTFSLNEIANKLRCNNSHVKVMFKTDIPRRLHYANNERIEGLYFDVTANWTASRYRNTRYCQGGTHGYDNAYRTMDVSSSRDSGKTLDLGVVARNTYDHLSTKALFLAYGPAFKINTTIGGFANIELYNMMAVQFLSPSELRQLLTGCLSLLERDQTLCLSTSCILADDVLGITPAPNNGTRGTLNPILRSPPPITRSPGVLYQNVTPLESIENVVNNSKDCGCPLTGQEAQTLISQVSTSTAGTSLPFGLPSLQQSLTTVSLLYQPNFVTAYSTHLQQPLWVSYTVTQTVVSASSQSLQRNCTLPDPRLTSQSGLSCDLQIDSNSSYTSLIPPDFWHTDDFTYKLSTNIVPMLKDFNSGIWSEFTNLVRNWTQLSGEVNILSGPIFDKNHNGVLDERDLTEGSSAIPSDYFAIISRCGSEGTALPSCSDSPEVLTFIIPHRDSYTFNCQNATDYLRDNMARVRDVELLTGLELFTSLPVQQAVQLRTSFTQNMWNSNIRS